MVLLSGVDHQQSNGCINGASKTNEIMIHIAGDPGGMSPDFVTLRHRTWIPDTGIMGALAFHDFSDKLVMILS